MEKLPWEAHIIRANLGKERPLSIAACYLMDKQLLVISAAGRIYCLDRRNLEPRWVNTLRYPLAKAPVESATHYCFLLKDHQGSYWLQTISKSPAPSATASRCACRSRPPRGFAPTRR